jgi:hypothetical protein
MNIHTTSLLPGCRSVVLERTLGWIKGMVERFHIATAFMEAMAIECVTLLTPAGARAQRAATPGPATWSNPKLPAGAWALRVERFHEPGRVPKTCGQVSRDGDRLSQ